MKKNAQKPSLNRLLGFPSLDATARKEERTSHQKDRMKWWHDAKFGMFVHWGLYSACNTDCITMTNMGIPVRDYVEKLDPLFTAKRFDADELVALAVKAGCKYMVVTTRHHDGYCLWNTDTTRFSSVHMSPKRDLIAEYVRAARKAGMRIGFYYSLLDWRYQAYWDGPRKDPKGWGALVDY